MVRGASCAPAATFDTCTCSAADRELTKLPVVRVSSAARNSRAVWYLEAGDLSSAFRIAPSTPG